MSDRTSHRRRARQTRAKQARAGINMTDRQAVSLLTGFSSGELTELGGFAEDTEDGCERCHVAKAETRYGDLLVCWECRETFPKFQPWRICPESGEYLDTLTGKPFVFNEVLP
jgi:hypothetical protein